MRHVFAALTCLALLAGCGKTSPAESGRVSIAASDKGFEPSSVTVKKGVPTTLVFTRTTDDTCATEVVFPELGKKEDLPKGKPVAIAIPTDREQTLTFQCGMGMYKSSVVVATK